MAWMAQQPCLISGEPEATTHHVRFCGSPKNDRRCIRLAWRYHLENFGPTSIEKLGKAKWQALHGVDIEAAISDYNRRFDALTP